jgi:hypothetical protein
MFRAPLIGLLAAIGLSATPAIARPLVELEVVDREHGGILDRHRHRGEHWIAGMPGHRYSVRLTNTTGERILVVLSVDGINAVSGQTAAADQAGYVLHPWQSTEITGWRKSLEDVAAFVFTDVPDSYAARTGRPDHVGVIGVAAFREARPRPLPAAPPPQVARGADAAAAAAPARESSQADAMAGAEERSAQRLGTGHGDREWSPVSRTGFVRASRYPAQVLQLRYDAPERLVALGILPWRNVAGYGTPRAFPGGFVPDPDF